MGAVTVVTDNDRAILAFARELHAVLGFDRVWLLDAQGGQTTTPDGEYRLLLVSKRYRTLEPRERPIVLHDIFYSVGGFAPLDLICLTPEEFETAKGRITLVSAVTADAIDLLAEAHAGLR